jgi:SAM-dependent methyltransferase
MSYYSDYYRIDKTAKSKHFWKYFSDVDGPILDIGCTTGNFVQWSPENIVGVDLDARALAVAAKRDFTVCCADIDQGLSFAGESFKGVNCSAVLEHVRNPLRLMREIWRVTRYGFNYWRDYTHLTPFTKEGLQRVAIDGGFRNFQISRYAFNYLKYLRGSKGINVRARLDNIERLMALVLSKDLVLVACK